MQIADNRKGTNRQEVDGFSQGSRRGSNGIPGQGVTALLQADKGSKIQSRALPRGHGLQSLPMFLLCH